MFVIVPCSQGPSLDSRRRLPPYALDIKPTWSWKEHSSDMWSRGAGVTVDAAAELAGVDVAAIRRWAAVGLLAVERRGDVEAVPLRELEALILRFPHRERVSDEELERLVEGRSAS